MAWSFTAAAERVLTEAAGWTSRDDRDDDYLHAPEVMLGLLAEAECRAAEMLLAHGVDTAAVRKRWPALRLGAEVRKRDFSPAVVAALEAAVDRLWEYPRPLVLATEHILLGLVAAPGETAAWLAEHGFDPDRLEVQIHRLYGHDPGPLPLDASQSAQTAEDVVAADVAANAPNAARTHPGHLPEGEGTGFATRRSIEAPALRIIDAAANRAREGLRVVEDYVRLVLDDRHLTRELKELRHDLQAVLRFAGQDDLLACRDTLSDVGTSVSTAAESERADLASVVAANWKRLQEALRSLEEYAKIAHPTAAAEIERLRYRSYTLERAVEITGTSCERLAVARVCVLVDGRGTSADFERLVDAVIAGGAPMIQLRDKTLPDRDLLRRAELLRARTSAAGVLCIVNDRADIAAAVHADGVHVGQDDLPVKQARSIVGPRGLVGVSTHSIEQARQAVLDGANYIGVGPTFPSMTKGFNEFTGIELLRAVAAEIRLPAFAIGGVSLDNLAAVTEAGISRAAISGAIAAANDPAAAMAEFVSRLSSDHRSSRHDST